MPTVTREEFLRDAAGVLRRSETEGPVVILGEDGKLGMIVHAPRDVRLSDADRELALVVRWLRTQAVPVPHAVRATERTIQMLTDRLERGEHRQGDG